MTPDMVRTARRLYDAGEMTVEAIARTLGVSRGTVYRHLDVDAAAASLGSQPGKDR